MKNPIKSNILTSPTELAPAITASSRARRETDREALRHAIVRPPPRNDVTPPLKLEQRDIASLKPAGRRVRKASATLLEDLNDSLGQFGICDAVLITDTGEIINGHSLVEACKRQGITDVPCLIVGHLTNTKIRRLSISLNRIQEKGEWDFEELRAEVNEPSLELTQR